MAYSNPTPGSLKRKRRRRQDKPAISARLILDGSINGQVGLLSDDLLDDLYPTSSPTEESSTVYAAITPWTTHPSATTSNWCIIPLRRQQKTDKKPAASTIRFPATGSCALAILQLLHTFAPDRVPRQNTPIEICVLDVAPVVLDTVYISVDGDALERLEDVRAKYDGGFVQSAKTSGTYGAVRKQRHASEVEDTQKKLVEGALRQALLIHSGTQLPLQLTHPVTHAAAPPAKVLACEPVGQGMLGSATKIVITSAAEKRQDIPNHRALMSPRLDEETDEDTSNEAFYSATETNSPMKPVVTSKSTTDLSNTDDLFDSSTEDSNLSDDSDDMISLAKPSLVEQSSGLSSVRTSATPRPFGSRNTGISTPGSVYSNMTTSTVRGLQAQRSKVFRTQGLVERISDELIHPQPANDEDDEARVYVDAASLVRLGCFSGDWVRLEPSDNSFLPRFSAFGDGHGLAEQRTWRPVKVYGLPEHMSKRPPRYRVNPRQDRRDSISSVATMSSSVATIYMSPILLINLQNPENVTLSTMPAPKRAALRPGATGRLTSSTPKVPPTASEVTLRKVVTPVSNERALNQALFANLKVFFERKQRVVKAGDLIAVPVDSTLGRSLFEGNAEQDESNTTALLTMNNGNSKQRNTSTFNVAWFSIEAVNTQSTDTAEVPDEVDTWNGVALIDPTKMMMRQSGDCHQRLPPATSSTWMFYLGLRRIPPRSPMAINPPAGPIEAPRLFISSLQRRLRELVSVAISPRAVHLGMPPVAVLITSTQRSIGKAYSVEKTCADLGVHYFPIDAYDIASEGDGGGNVDTKAQGLLEARCERALDCGPEVTAICINHLEMLSSDRVVASLKTVLQSARVLVATTTDIDKISDSVRGLFSHELEMSAPDELEREGILRDVVAESGVATASEVDLASIAVKTAALVAGDLVDVVERAVVARTERLDKLALAMTESSGTPVTVKDVQLSGGVAATSLIPADFDAAVDLARKNFADAIGAPKIPNVQWSDVGGLANVKDAVVETIQLPLSRPELFAKGLKKRSGILFYGPPGTGKTLLAKAIATEFSLNFFSVKGPELLNMYIGESEANVRRVFQRARDARPCVVFFDELDSVAPKRGNQGDSGGVMDRIVSQLLAELDGMSDGEESGGGVFVIGATNRPDLLDQALLRPGRFDKMLYLGISDTHDKQATILQALTRKFAMDPSLSLERVASTLPFTFTGADLYALCSDAMLKAVTRSARLVDEHLAQINVERLHSGQTKASVAYYFDHYAKDDDLEVRVTEEDFVLARRELVPSVSEEELRHYERVRSTFEGAGKTQEGAANGTTAHANDTSVSNGVHDTARSSNAATAAAAARAKMNEYVKRQQSSDSKRNGVRHNAVPNGSNRHVDADDEDYVIRTDRLNLNGASNPSSRPPLSKGKGKGKGREMVSPVRVAEEGDGEDLYD